VFDLAPLRHAPFLAPDLKLTAAGARRLSPAFMPAPRGRLVALVGGDESAEFTRQNALIASAWGPAVLACEAVPGRHHLNVLNELAQPGSRTHGWGLQLLGLTACDATRAGQANVRYRDQKGDQNADQNGTPRLPKVG
jgi:arylformamidase